jgi:hypothetical protein
LGASHRFRFSAGVVSLGIEESFESANKRVSECLGIALEQGSRRRIYWIESEMPERISPFQEKILQETESLFGKESVPEQRSNEAAAKGADVYAKT